MSYIFACLDLDGSAKVILPFPYGNVVVWYLLDLPNVLAVFGDGNNVLFYPVCCSLLVTNLVLFCLFDTKEFCL